MNVIVDASAVGAVLFDEPEGPMVLAHVEDDTLVAPHLIDYEIATIGLMKLRRGLEGQPQVIAALEGFRFSGIRRVRVPAVAAIALALQTGVSASDAAYLWLALSMDCELVTLDRKLSAADRRLRGDPA